MIYYVFARYFSALRNLSPEEEAILGKGELLVRAGDVETLLRRQYNLSPEERIPLTNPLGRHAQNVFVHLCDWVDHQLGREICRNPPVPVVVARRTLSILFNHIPQTKLIDQTHATFFHLFTHFDAQLGARGVLNGLLSTKPDAMVPLELVVIFARIIEEMHKLGVELSPKD